MNSGRTVTIVFDTELGWGSIENGRLAQRERDGVFDRARACLPRLVDEFARLSIPATWAVVGALAVRDPRDRLDHLPSARVAELHRALAEARRESLAWPDLLPTLRGIPQMEIACHGFSHTRFDYPGLSAGAVAREIALWRDASDVGVEPISMVCPRDTIAFLDELGGAGVEVLRLPPGFAGPRPALHRHLRWPSPSRVVQLPGTGARPADTRSGPTGVEGTLFFRGGTALPGRGRLLYSRIRTRHATARHDRTVLWLHPFNFGESDGLLPAFMRLLARLARERDRGRVRFETLNSVAEAP